MIVISDTTPIISFLKIDRLDLLETLFDIVQIPKSVFAELTGNSKYKAEAEIIKNSTFIRVMDDIDEDYVSLLRRSAGLDLGESEAIYLSDNKKADLFLMDEIRGREVAIRIRLNDSYIIFFCLFDSIGKDMHPLRLILTIMPTPKILKHRFHSSIQRQAMFPVFDWGIVAVSRDCEF